MALPESVPRFRRAEALIPVSHLGVDNSSRNAGDTLSGVASHFTGVGQWARACMLHEGLLRASLHFALRASLRLFKSFHTI